MGATTTIAWCDHSASPWYGCTEVHTGCDHCYARELAKRNPATLGVWGPDGTRVKSKSFLRNLRQWNRQAADTGRVASVFPSLCDPFEDRPELEPWRREMFQAIDECPNLRFLLLTKRPENVRRMWTWSKVPGHVSQNEGDGWRHDFRPNVWLGYSASDQATLDAGIHHLHNCRDLCPVRFLSLEPLLGEIQLQHDYDGRLVRNHLGQPEGIGWVIIGGESGPHARPMNLAWARSLLDQCQEAGVKAFFKQAGSNPFNGECPSAPFDGSCGHALGWVDGRHYLRLRDPKGGDLSELPEWCHVRQFPEVPHAQA